ncbi:HMG1/2-like protein [Bidens hawaiensis]|uniref:HMG1/2-like protein n=1 Tax=Bidens hawaiensis TaxID=980011 RepID=UPI00404AD4E7
MKAGKSAAAPKKSNAKLAVKKATPKAKAAKDPNKPKRPASAFFVFMEEFRKQYKAEHPENKSVAAVGKAGGAKWKAMSTSDKAPYVAKADKRKKEYEKTMAAYNKKLASGGDDADDDSDKSKSEVNNNEEEEEEDEDSGDDEEENDE